MSLNLNAAIQTLQTSKEPWVSYTQIIDLSNPYTDSSYNNHVTFKDDYVQITMPQPIDMIYNLCIFKMEDKKEENIDLFLYSNQSCRKINSNFLFNEEHQPLCIRCKKPSYPCYISFTAVIFKKTVRSRLKATR